MFADCFKTFDLNQTCVIICSVGVHANTKLKYPKSNRLFLDKLMVAQPVKKCPVFMEPSTALCVIVDPVLSHVNSIHTFVPYFCEIHFETFLPFISKSPKWHLPLRFSK